MSEPETPRTSPTVSVSNYGELGDISEKGVFKRGNFLPLKLPQTGVEKNFFEKVVIFLPNEPFNI